jgi:hypothetical protein
MHENQIIKLTSHCGGRRNVLQKFGNNRINYFATEDDILFYEHFDMDMSYTRVLHITVAHL